MSKSAPCVSLVGGVSEKICQTSLDLFLLPPLIICMLVGFCEDVVYQRWETYDLCMSVTVPYFTGSQEVGLSHGPYAP